MSARRPLDVEAIALSGVHLIEASAGTGKTYTITSLILRAVVELELPLEKIAAVTFTNAATAELRHRVGERLFAASEALARGEAPASDQVLQHLLALPDKRKVEQLVVQALRDLDRAAVFTIHGFSQRMLSEHAFESGARYEVELIGDQSRLVYDALVDFWSARVARLPEAEFRLLGGLHFFEDLRQVAREASVAADAELVQLLESEPLQAALVRLEGPFEKARESWQTSGVEARAQLGSDAINKNILRASSLDRDVEQWDEYFERGDSARVLPEARARWTQTKVSSALKSKSKISVSHPFFEAIEGLCRLHDELDVVIHARRAELRAELVGFVRARVSREHLRAGTQSFDDLLLDLRAALRHPERGAPLAAAIRGAFPVALIDEFQDTDPVQYEIFRRLFAEGQASTHGALFLIGDPKQSIYSFRGADVYSYLSAAGDAAGGVWTLSTSYRSGPGLVAAQNALLGRPRQPFGTAAIACDPVHAAPGRKDLLEDRQGQPLPGLVVRRSEEGAGRLLLAQAAREVAFFLAAGHRLAGEAVTPGHLAVLTRTNRDAQQVQAELARLRIPAVMHGDRSVFESPEALELRRILRALAEPSASRRTRAALATRFLGLDAQQLGALDVETGELERWTEILKSRSEDWKNRGVVQALERLSEDTGLVARTLGEFDGERRITNYRHLVELLHEAETRSHLGVSGLLRFFEAAIADPMGHAMAAEARQLRLESDHDAVTLTTIHKSKGLEYDIVFLPTIGLWTDLWESTAYRFRDEEAERTLLEVRDPRERDGSFELAQAAARQESLRLCYVALTRAKHHVVAFLPNLSAGRGKGDFSPLAYYLYEQSAPEPGGVEQLARHVKDLSDEVRAAEEAALTAESAGTLRFLPCSDAPLPPFQRPENTTVLRALPLPTAIVDGERTSSFSSMTRSHDSKLSRASREGRDVDEATALNEGLFPDREPSQPDDKGGHEAPIVLADFPRGVGPGEALHALLEHADFAEGDAASRRLVVERELSRCGIGAEHVQSAARAVEDVLQTPLDGGGLTLGRLARGARRTELEFSLPVGHERARLTPRRLARALGFVDPEDRGARRSEPSGPCCFSQDYLAELAALPFPAWSGFLRGFIDLVFEFEGRLYVVDYKSNYLGGTYGDYGSQALARAMREHHYLLQAMLYALAVHRHAESRRAGYDYQAHFGGVFYLFLRGMQPALGPSLGVFFLKPSARELADLSAVFREPGPSGAAQEPS